MRHYRCFLAAVVLLMLPLAGCGTYKELDETAYVFTLGADKSETNRIKISFRIPVPRVIGKIQGGAVGTSGGEEPYSNTSVNVPTVSEATTMAELYAGREISLEHVRSLFISEELAREDIEQALRSLLRNPELRSTVHLYVARGQASRLLFNNKPALEVNVSKFIDLVSHLDYVHGLSITAELGEFYNSMSIYGTAIAPLVSLNEKVLAERKAVEREKAGALIKSDEAGELDRKEKQELGKPKEQKGSPPPLRTPGSYLPGNLPREGGNPLEFTGVAVFRNGKMVGVLNGQGALAWNLLTGNFRSARVTFSDPIQPNHPVSVRIYSGRPPEVRVNFADKQVLITAKIVVDCDLESIPSGESLDGRTNQDKLQNLVSAQLKHWIMATVEETQQWGAEVFNFSAHSRRHFLTWNEWQAYNWSEAYKKARVEVEVFANLRRPGLLLGATKTLKR